MTGGYGNDTIYLGDGDDMTTPTDDPTAPPSEADDGGNDTIYGGGGNDVLIDGSGNNALYGDAGNDFIFAVDRDFLGVTDYVPTPDTVEGGDGNDTIAIDNGDTATGGAGEDLFNVIRSTQDAADIVTITDFDVAEDVLVLEWVGDVQTGDTVIFTENADGLIGTYDGIEIVQLNGLTAADIPNITGSFSYASSAPA